MDITGPATSPTARKRARTGDSIIPIEGGFVQDPEAGDSGGDDDDDEDGKGKDKKAGRRKIKIEFINDKSRRHITFSKRKAGIMKKAYELSTLTGTQVLLLVVSETGLVYTFTTAKLQPLVTQPEGKNLIQSCLNAPAGQPPSNMPVGATIGRSAPQPTVNAPGGLAINDDDGDDDSDGADREVKRPRRLSNEAGSADHPSAPMAIPNQPQSHGASPGIPPRVSPIQPQNGPPQPQQHAAPQPGVRPGQQPVSYGAPQTQPFHQDPSMGNGYMPPYNSYYGMQQQQQQGMPQGQQYPRQ